MSNEPTNPPRILIVDDDPFLFEILCHYLTRAGMSVTLAENAAQMYEQLANSRFDLILLDLMLPGEDGLTVCRRMRESGDPTPIIMVTGFRQDADRIVGLQTGADDYVCKPFNPRELLARVQAVLRRVRVEEHPAAPSPSGGVFRFGPFSFDLGTRLLDRRGEPVRLTTAEFALLKVFVRHPGRPMSRQELSRQARGRGLESTDRSLDVQVARLRRLIEQDSAKPRCIQTVRGLGYMFVPEAA